MYPNNYNPYQSPYDANRFNVNNPSYYQPQMSNNTGVKQQVVRVNGKNGAQAYQLMPNSSILLLDETAPIVWLKITDGAGYPTITPYDISPHKDELQIPEFDTKSLEERISKLEEIVSEQYVEKSNVESSQPVKRVISTTK